MRVVKLRKGWIIGTLSALALAGCGGTSSNSSPLSGANVADQNRTGKPAVAANPSSKTAMMLPVYLTIKPDTISEDIWVKLRSVALQTNSSEMTLGTAAKGVSLRLAGLRDVDGRRFLFLGMADLSNHVVRAKLTLDDQFTVEQLGAKPDVRTFAADAATGGGGKVDARLNLDPNAQFQDALVLELSLSKGAKDGEYVPQLTLGSASDVADLGRHEHSLVFGQFVKASGDKWTFKVAGGEQNFAISEELSKGDRKAPVEGAEVALAIGFDPATKTAVVSQWMPVTDKKTIALARIVAEQSEQKLAIFEVCQANEGTGATISLATNGKVIPAESIGKFGLVAFDTVEGVSTLAELLPETAMKVAQVEKPAKKATDDAAVATSEKGKESESQKPAEKSEKKK